MPAARATRAYLEGFQRNHSDVTLVALMILLIVFVIQFIGDTSRQERSINVN